MGSFGCGVSSDTQNWSPGNTRQSRSSSPDAVLVLALGACPIRRTGARPESPVARKGVQPLVEHHLARHRIVANDQRLGIVEQDLARHPAKVAERPFQALEPSRLPLVAEC